MITYTVKLRNPAGVVLQDQLPNSAFSWVIGERAVGNLSMAIPGGVIDPNWITPEAKIELWRRVDQLPPAQVGGQWLIDKVRVSGNYQNIIVDAYDFNGVAGHNIIDYPASTPEVTNAYTDKSGAADDVIKAFVRENIGALATDTTRALTGLTVEADTTLGETIAKQASRKNLLETMREISADCLEKGAYLTWGWAFAENEFTFYTRTGQLGNNHGSTSNDSLYVSYAAGNLINPELVADYSGELTVVKMGGTGTGVDRVIGTATNTARLARSQFARREYFGSGISTDDVATLNADASAKLGEKRARLVLTGQIVETDYFRYGVHFGYGDLLIAEYAGKTFDVHLDTVSGDVRGGIEKKLDMKFKGEEVI